MQFSHTAWLLSYLWLFYYNLIFSFAPEALQTPELTYSVIQNKPCFQPECKLIQMKSNLDKHMGLGNLACLDLLTQKGQHKPLALQPGLLR